MVEGVRRADHHRLWLHVGEHLRVVGERRHRGQRGIGLTRPLPSRFDGIREGNQRGVVVL